MFLIINDLDGFEVISQCSQKMWDALTPEQRASRMQTWIEKSKATRYEKKFAPDQIEVIRMRLKNGEKAVALSKEYGATRHTISAIKNQKGAYA